MPSFKAVYHNYSNAELENENYWLIVMENSHNVPAMTIYTLLPGPLGSL